MTSLGEHLKELLFGSYPSEPSEGIKKEWREAIHEHRNVSQVSVAEARKSQKKSVEAIQVAEQAIRLMEKGKSGKTTP